MTTFQMINEAVTRAVAEEREACAQMAEKLQCPDSSELFRVVTDEYEYVGLRISEAIRARGNKS